MAEARTLRIQLDDMLQEELLVAPLRDGHWMLLATPFPSEVELLYGDTIALDDPRDGVYRLRRVVERSTLVHYSWLMPREWFGSVAAERFFAEVEAAGGVWERQFGGVVNVHLPPGSRWDPVDAMGDGRAD